MSEVMNVGVMNVGQSINTVIRTSNLSSGPKILIYHLAQRKRINMVIITCMDCPDLSSVAGLNIWLNFSQDGTVNDFCDDQRCTKRQMWQI